VPRHRPDQPAFGLDLFPAKLQHRRMQNQDDNKTSLGVSINDLWRWSTTPPQSYLVYVVCLVLVLGLSYYAGTLNPKKKLSVTPQSTSLPRN
jgi:hypothetical protein